MAMTTTINISSSITVASADTKHDSDTKLAKFESSNSNATIDQCQGANNESPVSWPSKAVNESDSDEHCTDELARECKIIDNAKHKHITPNFKCNNEKLDSAPVVESASDNENGSQQMGNVVPYIKVETPERISLNNHKLNFGQAHTVVCQESDEDDSSHQSSSVTSNPTIPFSSQLSYVPPSSIARAMINSTGVQDYIPYPIIDEMSFIGSEKNDSLSNISTTSIISATRTTPPTSSGQVVGGGKVCSQTTKTTRVATSSNAISLGEIKRKHANSNQPTNNSSGSQAGHSLNGSTMIGNAAARLMDMGKRLLEASKGGDIELVRKLVVDLGAPFTSDWLGATALHIAAQSKFAEIAEILCKGGVNRDARTKLERTALHLAAQSGSLEIVDLLISYGCDINARDMLKMTPLHWAVERGHICIIERLLSAGADVDIKSKFQLTPIDIARNSEIYEIIDLFRNWTHNPRNETGLTNHRCKGNDNFDQSHEMTDFDCHLSLINTATTSRDDSVLDINDPCIDLVELEWAKLGFDADLFASTSDTSDEPKVEYLMKVVEELQRENLQLRQKVDQLSTDQ